MGEPYSMDINGTDFMKKKIKVFLKKKILPKMLLKYKTVI